MSPIETATSRVRAWRRTPALFVSENFGVEMDEWQRDAMLALSSGNRTQKRLALKACTGPGKSAVLAWIGWWRLACFASKGEHPKGAALSVTYENLKDNLWTELAKWQGRSDFLKSAFTWTKERIYANDHPETWFLSARSFARDADAEAIGRALSGLHSKYPFVLLDETGDMPVAVGRAAEQIFTGGPEDALIASAGNPTSTTGLLYHIATQAAAQWTVITVTADPMDAKRTPRVSVELAQQQIDLYGRDNAWVMATILGLFPPGGFNSLMSLDEVEASMKRHLRPDAYNWAQKRLGGDVARFGTDRTVIFARQGLRAWPPVVMRNADSMAVAARMALAKQRFESEIELIDGTGGYGSGVIDALRVAGHAPFEVQFAGKSPDPRYYNMRSYIWFKMAEWIKSGGALPPLPEMVRELTTPTYTFQDGKYRVEEKAQMVKRMGLSPDLGDALAVTFALPDMPKAAALPGQFGPGKLRAEWDPYEDGRS